MARLGKAEIARYQGAKWALELVEKKGLDEAVKELEMRGVRNIPLTTLEMSDVRKFENDTKVTCTKTICCMSLLTLRDEFDWGRKRLTRFMERFNKKTEVLEEDYATWADYRQILIDEVGIDIDIPNNCRRD